MDVVGSIVTEQGVTFAIVQVHAFRVETPQEAQDAIATYSPLFRGLPVVVMAVGGSEGTKYWGRSDLANFMARCRPSTIAWRKFSFARS